nr:hypothetical protein [uncultured Desulfobacter sp.]
MKNNISPTQPLDNGLKPAKLSPFGRLFRLFASWLGFTGLYAAFSVCPFCGQQGCPVGMASAGTVGAFLALCLQDWKRLFSYVKNRVTSSKN